MSGHSKWSTIKRKKGALDAKRGKIFSKLAKEITVAAKLGGGDPSANPRLRTVLMAAKSQNMPKDNVEKAIKKGTGDLPGVSYEESRYECYGPAGVGMVVDCLTDNKNRTVGEIRHLVNKHGGSMAENGAVSWNFDAKGAITVKRPEGSDDEAMFEKAIEAGAEDVEIEEDVYTIHTDPGDLHTVCGGLEEQGLEVDDAKLTMIPKTMIEVTGKDAGQVLKLMEVLEDLDDVQDIYSNFDIPDEEMAALAGE